MANGVLLVRSQVSRGQRCSEGELSGGASSYDVRIGGGSGFMERQM